MFLKYKTAKDELAALRTEERAKVAGCHTAICLGASAARVCVYVQK